MNDPLPPGASIPDLRYIPAGADWHGEERGLVGRSVIAFKVVPPDESGVLILENTFHAKGGPARHLHHAQDEWFYCAEGVFAFEIGDQRLTLNPGDSLLAPRGVPHVWAYTGEARGRVVIAFLPAGSMERFFRTVMKPNAAPPQDPEIWRAYGMELLGPPLTR